MADKKSPPIFGPYERTYADVTGKYLLVPPEDIEAMKNLILQQAKLATDQDQRIKELEAIREYFVIKRPDFFPEKKRPSKEPGSAYEMAKELIQLYPDALILHVKIPYHDLWIDTAQDFVQHWDAFDAMAKFEAEEKEKNEAILAKIATDFGQAYADKVRACLADSEADNGLSIVETTTGKRQSEDWDAFKHIFVDQYRDGGMEGDSFAGYIYIPLPDGKYLKSHYSM